MVIGVEEIVPLVNQLLKYGETKAPTEQHARLIVRWHVFKDTKLKIEEVGDHWLIKVIK